MVVLKVEFPARAADRGVAAALEEVGGAEEAREVPADGAAVAGEEEHLSLHHQPAQGLLLGKCAWKL